MTSGKPKPPARRDLSAPRKRDGSPPSRLESLISMPERLPFKEFVALVGVMFATIAFSLDAMLPALTNIGRELSPQDPDRAQLIIASFVLGMGAGTLVAGPLSDAFGRRRTILVGAAIYILGAAIAAAAGSLETALAARVLQGLGAAAPRMVMLAVVRDLHSGRQMARVMSFAMLVFTLIPVVAPLIGAGIASLVGWRGIFGAFAVFSLITTGWYALRQAETLAPRDRRPFSLSAIRDGLEEFARRRQVVAVTFVLTLVFGMLFAALSATQPIFERRFDMAGSFPLWFGLMALISGSGSLLNAQIVMRLGMRRVVARTMIAQTGLSAIMLALTLWNGLPESAYFGAYIAWTTSIFLVAALTIGNLNAMGMEPLGHIAGLAASIIGAIATVGAVAVAAPIVLAFDGTPMPLALSTLILSGVSVAAMRFVGEPRPVSGD